jgi:hypothetical protein
MLPKVQNILRPLRLTLAEQQTGVNDCERRISRRDFEIHPPEVRVVIDERTHIDFGPLRNGRVLVDTLGLRTQVLDPGMRTGPLRRVPLFEWLDEDVR